MCDAVGSVHAAPDRLLRIVAVEPLVGGRTKQAFYSTCHQATAIEVLTWYAWRWSIEVAFHDSKLPLRLAANNVSRTKCEIVCPLALVAREMPGRYALAMSSETS